MRTILLSLIAICVALSAIAQDAQSIYNSAVDQINCNTIKFIHAEAGRPDVAKEMSCYTFEAIEKTIPLDETKTTGKLARDIEAYKGKFDASKSLDTELQKVISFAMQRVKAKPRTGNVNEFEQVLLSIKEESVLNLASAEAEQTIAATDGTETDVEEEVETTDEETIVADNTGIQVDDEEGDTANGSWILWTAIIFSLVAIGISIYTLMMLQRIPAGGITTSANRPAENTDNSAAITELVVRLRQTENRLNEEIRRLEDRISSLPAAVVYPFDEPSSVREYHPMEAAIAEEREEESKKYEAENKEGLEERGEIISEIVEETQADEIEVVTDTDQEEEDQDFEENIAAEEEAYEEVAEEEVEQGDMITNALQSKEEMEIVTEHEPIAETDEQIEEVEGEGNFDGEYEEEDNDVVSEPVRYEQEENVAEEPSSVAEESEAPIAPAEVDNDQEAETEPYYVYASLPVGDSFHENDLAESPDQDSIFEIEMYEDVPNKAFISLLPYPELIRKMIAEPEKYLAPCCTYTGNPEGKRTIVLEEEGILRKDGDRWIVAEKAKVRFE